MARVIRKLWQEYLKSFVVSKCINQFNKVTGLRSKMRIGKIGLQIHTIYPHRLLPKFLSVHIVLLEIDGFTSFPVFNFKNLISMSLVVACENHLPLAPSIRGKFRGFPFRGARGRKAFCLT
jgi:hypothetical protein